MTAIGIDTIRLAPGDHRECDGRAPQERPGDRDRRQPDPEPAARRQHRADPVREREPEEPEGGDRDAHDDRTDGHLQPTARPPCEGERPGERQDEPGEVEMDRGQQDDRRREAERLDAEPVDDRESRPDREKGHGRIGGVPDTRQEAVRISDKTRPGQQERSTP